MMHLTKLTLNPRNVGVQRDLARPYELHRTLMRVAPDSSQRLLFRIEPIRQDSSPVVLVQSLNSGLSWSDLLDKGYLLNFSGPKSYSPVLHIGRNYAFRLTANPTIKQKRDGKIHGIRVPLIHDGPNIQGYPSYFDWLTRKAAQSGFEVLSVRDTPFRTATPRPDKENYKKSEIPHFGVRFDGVLRVTDTDLLLNALRNGIGPAKAFGFGLLSLAPLR